ncbi:TcmI family type II polyketide cyclase [Streptomyces sp. NPDC052236]|uniref:TcmI family type II polyketide cyclase n=1 Tax=Streptomyces sp. NPDC052236 TaxID=3365686 RepID=UPI0037D1CC5B
MHHALIVARMAPESAPDIAKIFAASDAGELPHLVGVTRRRLFQFGDVYMHMIESEMPPGPAIAKVAEHPVFRDISDQLTAYVSPYDPETWRSPKDAMAREFYRWDREGSSR